MTARSLVEASWVSIDVETAGPDPGEYALLSIGACLVNDPTRGFYVELIPDHDRVDPAAMAVHGLTLPHLHTNGTEPRIAMGRLQTWIAEQVDGPALMVGFNAPFDWMFLSRYFWTYLGGNPLGHAALDIKAVAMGWLGVPWAQTSLGTLAERLGLPTTLSHNALDDARQQADLLRALLDSPRPKGRSPVVRPTS